MVNWLMKPWGAVILNGYPFEVINATIIAAACLLFLAMWGLVEIGAMYGRRKAWTEYASIARRQDGTSGAMEPVRTTRRKSRNEKSIGPSDGKRRNAGTNTTPSRRRR